MGYDYKRGIALRSDIEKQLFEEIEEKSGVKEKGVITAPLPGIVFSIDVEVDELVNRLLIRAIDSGRIDDNEETIHKRLILYNETAQPVIDYYYNYKKLYRIDGSKSIEQVNKDIIEVIENKKYE